MPSETLLRGLPLAVLAVSLISVPVLLLEPQGLPRMRSLETELERRPDRECRAAA